MKRFFLTALKISFTALAAVFIGVLVVLNVLFPFKYTREVTRAAAEFSLDKKLVYAVIWTESKFAADAQSPAGARGLMQLMPATARWCALTLGEIYEAQRLSEPAYNIRLGAFYLRYLIDKYGEKNALAAYNAGEGNLIEWNGEIKFSETREYVKRVERAKKIYAFKSK